MVHQMCHYLEILKEKRSMSDTNRTRYLRIALLLVGLLFIFGISTLTVVWPSGWSWGQSEYLYMIYGVYATLGVFLVIASRNPLAHRSLIWFTVWSSAVHGGIMGIEAVANSHYSHLWGDVLALFVIAVVLAVLTPRGAKLGAASSPGTSMASTSRRTS